MMDVKQDNSPNVGIEFGGSGFGTGALTQLSYYLTKTSMTINAQLNALIQFRACPDPRNGVNRNVNGKEETILVGCIQSSPSIDKRASFPSTQTINATVQLRATPTIGDDGVITAESHPSYSQIISL